MNARGKSMWDAAAAMVGSPVRHRARKPGKAIDCVGVIICAAKAIGIDLPEPPRYGRDPDQSIVLEQLRACAATVVPSEILAGDLVVFSDGHGRPRHFAVTDGQGRIVHADGKVGRVLVQRIDTAMRSTLHSVWRLRGLV